MKRLNLFFRAGAEGAGDATRLRFTTEAPLIHSIDDANGKGVIGIDVMPNGQLRVGCWNEDKEFEPKFAVTPLAPFQRNWREAPLHEAPNLPTITDETAGETPNRTIVRHENGELAMMMTEIDGGRFVGWDLCARGHHVNACRCLGGPAEPEFITRWRTELQPSRTPVETREVRELRDPQLSADIDAAVEGAKAAVATYDAGF